MACPLCKSENERPDGLAKNSAVVMVDKDQSEVLLRMGPEVAAAVGKAIQLCSLSDESGEFLEVGDRLRGAAEALDPMLMFAKR